MLNGDVFVFDNVVHIYDLSDDNLKRPDSALDRQWHLKIGDMKRPKGQDKAYGITDAYKAFARRWTSEELGKMLFQESSTDMAMSQAVVLYDVYKDGFAPVRAQYDFHKTFPDRTLFCGGVDPAYPSVAAACDEMERQVKEWGAVSFKFYTGHLEGKSWRCDDPKIAYPLFEKARSLGVKVLQFHKGFPITRCKLEDLSPLDLQQAAMDFPDMIFGLHHLALPYFEETVYIAERFLNVHLVLSGTMNLPVVAPWEFKTYLGRILRDVGSDRILWGSECPLLGNPQPMIEWFEGACRGCSLKSVTYALGIRQKLMPISGITEVTVEGVRLSRAALERAARMYANQSPWVGVS